MTTIIGVVIAIAIICAASMSVPGRKLWIAIAAQFNKGANKIRSLDPVAQAQWEVDQKEEALVDGRVALAKQLGLIERVKHDKADAEAHVSELKAKIQTYLATKTADDRETAAQLVLELEKAEKFVAKLAARLETNQTTYRNNLEKLKFATRQVGELRDRVQNKDADLRFSRVDKEIAKIGEALNFEVGSTTTLAQIERVIQDEIDANNAEAQVAADLSGEGIETIHRSLDVEKNRAETALQAFERKLLADATPKAGAA